MKTHNEIVSNMKTTCCTILCITALTLTSALAQPGATPAGGRDTETARLTKFNLDFPGGTPKELLAAIEKVMGRPLNAIVPDEFADTSLPALKMNSVTVPELFQALVLASRPVGGKFGTECGFIAQGKPSEDAIWCFYANRATPPAKVCRFYSLAPYLDRGVSVDDITTAIETGWKMLGETSRPAISFHKDTKLLIAVGEERKLATIDAALKALEPPMTGYLGSGRRGPFGGGFQPQTTRTNAPAPAAK